MVTAPPVAPTVEGTLLPDPIIAGAGDAQGATSHPEAAAISAGTTGLGARFKAKDPKVIAPAIGLGAMLLAIVAMLAGRSPPPREVIAVPPPLVKPTPNTGQPTNGTPEPMVPDQRQQPTAGLQVGGVRFTGLPEGSRVTVDGNLVANPASENFFGAGMRAVKVESKLYQSYEGTVNVVAGKVTDVPVELKLRPVEARGAIEISCQPWCQITLDGHDTGKTSPARINASVGPHNLVLSNPPAGLAKKITVTVTENGVLKKSVKLDE